MEDNHREKLRVLARTIYKFQQLEETEKRWLKPLLSRGIVNTLRMLELLENRAMTFEELADELTIHPTTIKQRIYGLIDGGYPISLEGKVAIAETGRPRKLARKAVEEDSSRQLID